jgi:hypothetical protein
MVSNETIITIKKSIEEVFAYVSDLQNGPQWQPALVEARRITKGPLGIGTQYTGVRRFMGRNVESLIEYTTYVLDDKFSMKSVSENSPFEQSFLFEATKEGTRLTTKLDLQTTGLMGLAKPLIASSLKREMDSNFGDLKELLENQGKATSI